MSVLHYDDIPFHRERPSNYTQWMNELVYNPEDMPMKIKDIPKFESLNPEYNINILLYNYGYIPQRDEDIFKNPYVNIHYRSQNTGSKNIYLCLIEKGNILMLIVFYYFYILGSEYHYVGVHDLNMLLNCRHRESNIQIRSFWCHTCLHGFRYQKTYESHIDLCKKNIERTTMYNMPQETEVLFTDWNKTIRKEFVVYADLEAILPPDDQYHQRHEPIAAGLVLVQNGQTVFYKQFVGSGCVVAFLKCLEKISKTIVHPWYKENACKKMLPLTREENEIFRKSHYCYLCKKVSLNLVRDHDHFTGTYLGPACKKCNLARRVIPTLPVVFHNLKGYDMHHILKYAISEFPTWSLNPIALTTEKFLSLSAYVDKQTIKFIDSYQFLVSSLASLAKNLCVFPLTAQEFIRTGEINSGLLDSKGIFPYNHATSLDALVNTMELPPIWPEITSEEYDKAKLIWSSAGCRNLLDYMLLYMKLDVFLLADIFEAFRKKSMIDDGLEPLSFVSIPGMCWASALKHKQHKIELIRDPEMYSFFEGGIRGGMTFINKHHVKKDENTELLYIDINNLYGWALSQKLPCGEFRWMNKKHELDDLVERCKQIYNFDGDRGYVLEVDLEIPDHIHDKLMDLPVAPESQCPPGSKVKKLLLTHEPKKNYVVHCKLLQLWMSLGVLVTKVHRAVEFKQENIFKEYISLNTRKRASATNDFDREYYKLRNNSLYGKTIENLKNRIDLRLCNDPVRLVTYTSKPLFKRSMKIADNLIGILLSKEVVTLNRPMYIGQAVLDLSKLRMYELQYRELEKYRNEFNCEINIVAGDTDSFFLEVKNCKLKEQLLPKMIADGLLDTSNYDKHHPLHSRDLASVVGLFKDESEGVGFLEWIFLRPKCYSLLWADLSEKIKAKGITTKGTEINHQSYLDIYNDGTTLTVQQQRIISKNHAVYTSISNKKALQCFDDKRFWTGPNSSVPYGHRTIRDSCNDDSEDIF